MQNLFGKDINQLQEIVTSLGEKPFRGKQLYDWIYKKKIDSLDECSNLSKSLIQKLKDNGYIINHPKKVRELTDPEDGTKKFLFQLDDGQLIESVLMKYPFGNSACLSTQVGCAMGCTFCASGKNGKLRNLSAEEIAGQIISMENESGEPISNIVLMGMGEPLDNYDEVIRFIEIANKDMEIGQRHITLSTCGLVPKIYDLANEDLQINLAISLHSPFQERREKIMPVAKTNSLEDLIQASQDYFDKTGRRVTYEYTVIDNVNNTDEDVQELKKLLKNRPHHINLIPLNSVNTNQLNDSDYVYKFGDKLKKAGLHSTVRKRNGANIEAACGQLRNRELETT